MDELEALQAAFQEMQAVVNDRLSERCCIDLLLRLQKEKMITLIYTTDGKEYVTPAHLRTEIQRELVRAGGRISVVDLQPILNVDLSHIEKHLSQVLKKDSSIHLVGTTLISNAYVDVCCEELQSTLEQAGKLSIGTLSTRFDLPPDFLLTAITARLGSLVHGRLYSPTAGAESFLYTETYLRRVRARVRGAFSALTRPISLLSVAQQQHMEEELFADELAALLCSGRLHGALQENRGANTIFLPQVFVHARDHYIDSFAAANSFVPYDHLRSQFQLSNPERTLSRRIPGGLPLSTCYATPALLDSLDAAVGAALTSATWLQISPILPSSLSDADIAQLLQHCAALNDAIQTTTQSLRKSGQSKRGEDAEQRAHELTMPPLLIEDEYLISGTLLRKVMEAVSQGVRTVIAQDPLLFQAAHQQLRHSLDAASSPHVESRSEKQAQRKKQRNKKKRGKAASRETTDDATATSQAAQEPTLLVSEEKITEWILATAPEWRDMPELTTVLLERHLAPRLLEIQQSAAAALFKERRSVGPTQSTAQQEACARLTFMYLNLCLFSKHMGLFAELQGERDAGKGAPASSEKTGKKTDRGGKQGGKKSGKGKRGKGDHSDDEADSSSSGAAATSEAHPCLGGAFGQPLERHLIRTLGLELCNALAEQVCTRHMLEFVPDLNRAARRKLFAKLPRAAADGLHAAYDAQSAAALAAAVSEECAATLAIRLPPLSREREHKLITQHRENLQAQLADAVASGEEPELVLQIVVTLLILRQHRTLLHIPGGLVGRLAQLASEQLQDNSARKQLNRFRQLVVRFLVARGREARASSEPAAEAGVVDDEAVDEDSASVLARARDFLPSIAALVEETKNVSEI